MGREHNVPMFLWVATAILAHLAWAGGADRISKRLEETLFIRRFAESVRSQVKSSLAPVEVALVDADDLEELEERDEPSPTGDTADPDPTEPHDVDAVDDHEADRDDPDPAETEAPKPDERQRDPEEIAKEKREQEQDRIEPKPEAEEEKEKKAEVAKETPKQITQLKLEKRIAVRQHVQDENQPDNPNASYIADQANTVDEETQARVTSTTQNDPSPTPGSSHAGPIEAPGNASETEVAQDEDRPGEIDRAPQEDKGAPRVAEHDAPPSGGDPNTALPPQQAVAPIPERAPGQKGQQARAAQEETAASPNSVATPRGSWTIAEAQREQEARKARRARKKRLPPPKPRPGQLLGLGSGRTTESGVNLSLDPFAARTAIGHDQLALERRADGERRRSVHRGSWKSMGLEKWRSAIENYVANVKPGNQTKLNAARVPFASYLNQIHNRLHPIFADSFLGSLSSLPGSHPMNQRGIKTDLEIAVSQVDGSVVRMGVTKTSGVTAFDIAALESVERAQPFGPPPKSIVSPDGNVYLHWEFHRNPYYACSTYFARPYILKTAPKTAPPKVPPAEERPFGPREQGAPPGGERHGERRERKPAPRPAALPARRNG